MPHRRFPRSIVLVAASLLLAALACQQSAGSLNQGSGTYDDPVAARKFAKTTDYEIRALSAVRPMEDQPAPPPAPEGMGYMKVQFEIKCNKSPDHICNVTTIRSKVKVVSESGVLYNPSRLITAEPPLQGEILGEASIAGWLVFEVPDAVTITQAIAQYGPDDENLVFFKLP